MNKLKASIYKLKVNQLDNRSNLNKNYCIINKIRYL